MKRNLNKFFNRLLNIFSAKVIQSKLSQSKAFQSKLTQIATPVLFAAVVFTCVYMLVANSIANKAAVRTRQFNESFEAANQSLKAVVDKENVKLVLENTNAENIRAENTTNAKFATEEMTPTDEVLPTEAKTLDPKVIQEMVNDALKRGDIKSEEQVAYQKQLENEALVYLLLDENSIDEY